MLFWMAFLLDGCCWGSVSLCDSWWVVVFVAVFSGGREGVDLDIVGLGGGLTGVLFAVRLQWFNFCFYLPLDFNYLIESWNVFELF
jgi:hypothetical protein